MNEIDVRRVDLNLLIVLEALLSEASVTAAARKLGVGQSAASHALGRLRAVFGDPLLVRTGRTMSPTPRAESLRQPLSRWLADGDRLLGHRGPFEARTTTRTFVLRSPDLLAPLVPRLVGRLMQEAPLARLEMTQRDSDDATALDRGAADVALGTALKEGTAIVTRGLGDIHFGVVARAGHPALRRRGRLSTAAWLSHPHVVVRSGSSSQSVVASALEAAGRQRRVGLVLPTFLAAVVTVARTDMFLAAPVELVEPLLEPLGLVAVASPLAIPAVPVAALWPERLSAEPAHRFFRSLVIEEVATVTTASRARRA